MQQAASSDTGGPGPASSFSIEDGVSVADCVRPRSTTLLSSGDGRRVVCASSSARVVCPRSTSQGRNRHSCKIHRQRVAVSGCWADAFSSLARVKSAAPTRARLMAGPRCSRAKRRRTPELSGWSCQTNAHQSPDESRQVDGRRAWSLPSPLPAVGSSLRFGRRKTARHLVGQRDANSTSRCTGRLHAVAT